MKTMPLTIEGSNWESREKGKDELREAYENK